MAKDKSKKKDKKSAATERLSPVKLWVFALIPAVFAFLLYANTFEHGYVLDDGPAISENVVVQEGMDGLGTIWETNYRYGYWNEPGTLYRPLALTLFAWQWEHWPNDPHPAHVINVLLFAAGCLALFFLLFQWFGRNNIWVPFIATILFAAHPIHTEVVANLKSADELLAFLFGCIALLALWKNGSRILSLWTAIALVSFFLAMSSKEGAITLVAVVPLMFFFFSDEVPLRKGLLSAAWLLVPVVVYFMLRHEALGSFTSARDGVATLDNMLAGLHGAEWLATAIKLCGMYLWKMLVAHPLSHDYSRYQVEAVSFANWTVWASVLAYGAMIAFAVRSFKSKHPVSFAILFFLATFSLYANLVFTIGTHFGERLLFLPSVGFCIALAWLVWKWGTLKTATFEPQKAMLPLAALAVVTLAYSGKTMNRNEDWASGIDLYEADVINSPNSCRTHYRLGMAYMKERALVAKTEEEKNKWLRKALGTLGDAVKIYPQFADARSEMGLAYQRLGYRDQAVAEYNKVLEGNPNHYTTLNNMGTVLFENAKFEQATEYFKKALEANPRYKDAAGNLASCYGTIGEYGEAVKWFKRALEIDPNEPSYYYYLGITYSNIGDMVEAEKWYSEAYKRDPNLPPRR